MNRVEVKNKLKKLIRGLILSNLDGEIEIPDAVANQILQSYGCTIDEKPEINENLDNFVRNLQKYIEDNHSPNDKSTAIEEELNSDLSLLEKYNEAKSEYVDVTSELVKTLSDVAKHKETYSEYFRNECKAKDTNVEILNKKCQFLKLQFFLKLYGEENALKAHLALREKLKEELFHMKKKYCDIVDYNSRMDEIKSNKTFNDMFKVYKELRRIEQSNEILETI